MIRQVNLLSKKKQGVTPEKIGLGVLGVGLVALIGYGAYNQFLLSSLQKKLQAAQIANIEAATLFKAKRIAAGLPDSEALKQEISNLQTKFSNNAPLLNLMDKGGLGSATGHGRLLTLLASKNEPDLWITSIEVDSKGESIALTGKSLSREAVLRYANSLNRSLQAGSAAPIFTAIQMNQEEFPVKNQPDSKKAGVNFRLN